MIKAKIFETTKFIQIIFSILILFCSSILFAQENLAQLENPENQQPEEPKIESKNKEDKSLLDTTKKPTLTTKEN